MSNKSENQRLELIANLLDALCTALPYVEDALDDNMFKTASVRAAHRKISAAIGEASVELDGETK